MTYTHSNKLLLLKIPNPTKTPSTPNYINNKTSTKITKQTIITNKSQIIKKNQKSYINLKSTISNQKIKQKKNTYLNLQQQN